ncbi:MAG: penicillin-binding protein 2 [Candidatus Doudnabacteria bacterium]|nr:penicillin-binding protein 2 [Candidatus Doudnabacteria bacterium]
MYNPFEVQTSFNSKKSQKPLDWEESALDRFSSVEEVHDTEHTSPNLFWLKLLLLAAFLTLISRMFYLQILHGSEFRMLADDNRIRSQVVLAPRGLIVDRNGQVLAQNTGSFNLVAIPFDLPKNAADLQAEIQNLAKSFGLNADAVTQKISSSNRSSIDSLEIKQGLDPSQSILFQTMSGQFPGFMAQQIPIRQYLDPLPFASVLGYTGLVSPGDLTPENQALYGTVDFIGKSGVEDSYEKYLHGQNGANTIEVDATGKFLSALGQEQPLAGDKLVLNIDQGLQDLLYKELSTALSPRAAAVALDPRDGAVLALVSLPGFDDNLFAGGISQQEYRQLTTDPNLPMYNRAISGQYPPGSTSKLMTATAGLETGVINANTVINDNGNLIVPNKFGGAAAQFHGWKPGGLGPMTVRSAIALSSDIYFYQVAGGSPNGVMEGLGPDRLADYFRKFGLGRPLGIDMPGEQAGLVPDPAWKMEYFHNDPLLGKWYLGDTYHMGIGQGFVLVTPLQVAEWTAVVANGGVGFVPQVAQKAVDQNGNVVWQSQPKVLVSNIASPDVFKIVQQGMRQTVTDGTAKPLNSLPITSAGKTGTSQFDGANPTRTHAWFTAYAPYENPQIVITVLVEAGGEGNAVAEPVVKSALQWWAENRYKK